MWCSMCPFLATCEDPARDGGGCDCDGSDDFGVDPIDYGDDEEYSEEQESEVWPRVVKVAEREAQKHPHGGLWQLKKGGK